MMVLDVFIGMVLIYFLYSLLSSIIAELISSWIGMRARMLRQGIDNILNDVQTGVIKSDFSRWVNDILMFEDKNFKYTTAGKFYEEATIKYLAKPGDQAWYSLRNRKPSYISKENFVITVLNMFSNRGRGISEWEKIKFAIETNAMHLDPETHQMFVNLVKRSNDKFEDFVALLQNHFEETMDRVNGWYKRKIGLIIFIIGFFACFLFNVDSIEIAKILVENKNIRTELADYAGVLVKEGKLDSALMSRNDTLAKYEQLLKNKETTLDAIYKANQILGLAWNYGLDTTAKKYILKEKKSTRGFYLSDTTFFKENWSKLKEVESDYISLQSKIPKLSKKELKDTLDKLEKFSIKRDSVISNINQITKYKYYSIRDVKIHKDTVIIRGQREKCFCAKACFIISATFFHPLKLLGILITAFALSLGANFWFDLLKKLVSIREAGKKPEEEAKKQELTKDIQLKGDKIISQDPVEIAISKYRGYWESLPGFLAVNKVWSSKETNERIVEVKFHSKENKEGKEEVINITVNNIDFEVKVRFEYTNSQYLPNQGEHIGIITHSHSKTRSTPTGLVKLRTETIPFLLCCGHALRSDASTYLDLSKSSINLNLNGKTIDGNVKHLEMTSYLDCSLIHLMEEIPTEIPGVADETPEHKIYTIETYRKITDAESWHTKVLINTSKGIKKAIICDTEQNCLFDIKSAYKARNYNLIKLCDENFDFSKEVTVAGDSGSLVMDENYVPIGIIVGGEVGKNKYSYAIGLSEVFDHLNLITKS